MQCLDVLNDGIELGSCHEIRYAIFPEIPEELCHFRDPSADFLHESFVHSIQIFQDTPDSIDCKTFRFLFGSKNDRFQHVTGGLNGPRAHLLKVAQGV